MRHDEPLPNSICFVNCRVFAILFYHRYNSVATLARNSVETKDNHTFSFTRIFILALTAAIASNRPLLGCDDLRIGGPAPDFRVLRLHPGKEKVVHLKDYQGKVLILEFWATWCAPCRNASTHLNSLIQKLEGRDVCVLCVSDETDAEIREYLAKTKVHYEVATDQTGSIQKAFRVAGLPHAALIDNKGVLKWTGDPRDLSIKAVHDFLQTGEVTKIQDQSAAQVEPKETGVVLLALKIRRKRFSDSRSAVFSHGRSSRSIELHCKGAPLRSILAFICESGGLRLRIDDSLSQEHLDIDYQCSSIEPNNPGYEPLKSALSSTLGLKVETVVEDCSVWVARAPDPHVPLGDGAEEIGFNEDRLYSLQNVSFSRILSSLEGRYKVLLCDEAELNGNYSVAYPITPKFEDVRKYLGDEYGIVFSKERRKVSFVTVTKSVEADVGKTKNH